MDRRRFLLASLAAAILSPRGAEAQSAASRIGYLGPSSLALEQYLLDAFQQVLRDLGYAEGRLLIESRWADGDDRRLPGLAAELVRAGPDVIVTSGTPGAIAAKNATRTIPIVMATSGDPVRSGLVASLAKPGGNITGFTTLGPEAEGKRLEFLKQAVPALSRLAVLWNPANPVLRFYVEQMHVAAKALNVTVGPIVEVRRVDDFERAFVIVGDARPDALVVIADRFLFAHHTRIIEFTKLRQLAGMFPYTEYVHAGGLMSYAPSNVEMFRGAAVYVDKILKGAAPGGLPVQQPTKFELVINRRTAKSLGLTLSQPLLARADQVID